MNGYRRSRRLIQLAQLLAVASVTSAVSLQDFQAITIIQVPSLSCLGAYGSKISGCSRRDFQDGNQCSASCAKGIQQDQSDVIAACKNFEVNASSLLGLTLQGGLLDALCPNFQATSVTSTVKSTTTHTFLTPSQTLETSTSKSTTRTTESSSTITTSTITTSTPGSSEILTTIPSIPTETGTTIISTTPTEASSTTTVSSTSVASPTQTADDGGQSDRGSSGGGSPFDTVFAGGAQSKFQTSAGMLVALTGTLITALLM
ncbi:hypothetical protein GGS24DRAFT_58733 [Hypoxylon argillaceum]|nr:hypothetical protein GGS24DRAFT_58733 [Hypoxylon argillaceum]